jgi:hypothetical protein
LAISARQAAQPLVPVATRTLVRRSAGGLRSPAAAVRTPWWRDRDGPAAPRAWRGSVSDPLPLQRRVLGRVLADAHRRHHGANCPWTFLSAACLGCRGRTGEAGACTERDLLVWTCGTPAGARSQGSIGCCSRDCSGVRITSEGPVIAARRIDRLRCREAGTGCPAPRPRQHRRRCECHIPVPSDPGCHARSPCCPRCCL